MELFSTISLKMGTTSDMLDLCMHSWKSCQQSHNEQPYTAFKSQASSFKTGRDSWYMQHKDDKRCKHHSICGNNKNSCPRSISLFLLSIPSCHHYLQSELCMYICTHKSILSSLYEFISANSL